MSYDDLLEVWATTAGDYTVLLLAMFTLQMAGVLFAIVRQFLGFDGRT